MAITLAEYAKVAPGTYNAQVFESIAKNTAFTNALAFEILTGAEHKYVKRDSLPTTAARALGGTVTASEAVNSVVTRKLALLGVKHTGIDDRFDQTLINDQLGAMNLSLALTIEELMFKGDKAATPVEPDGIQAQATNLANGIAALKVNLIDQAVTQVRGGNLKWFCGRGLYVRLAEAARNSKLGQITVGSDSAGYQIVQLAGIPLVRVGDDSTGAEILGFTEGVGTNETSLYLCSMDGTGLYGLTDGAVKTKRIEGDFGATFTMGVNMELVLKDPKAAIRISGITDAAIA